MTSLDVSGTFDNSQADTDDRREVLSRLKFAESIYVVMEHDGESYKVPFKRYYLIMNLNHGLARSADSLPADMAVNMRFHRASSECSLVKMVDNLEVIKISDNSKVTIPVKYDEQVIPIQNPLLHAYYAFSPELETTMSRVQQKNLEINFMGELKIK